MKKIGTQVHLPWKREQGSKQQGARACPGVLAKGLYIHKKHKNKKINK